MTTDVGAAVTQDGWDVLLRDGGIGHVRQLTADDEAALLDLNERVSARTRLMRYFSASERPGRWYVEHLLAQARAGNALVALVGDVLVGVASWSRLESDPAVADLGMVPLPPSTRRSQRAGAVPRQVRTSSARVTFAPVPRFGVFLTMVRALIARCGRRDRR